MANAAQSSSKSWIYWIVGIVLAALVVLGVRALTRDVVQVRTVPATFQTLSTTVGTGGKVEPVEEFQAHAPFPGVIKQIFVSVGQHVSKGTLLIKMDAADAQARVAAAQTALSSAENGQTELQSGGNREDLNRYKSELASATLEQQQATSELSAKKLLLQKGAASPAEVAVAQQRVDAANLSLQNARVHSTQRYNPQDLANAASRVADARATLASAQNNLANILMRSPIDGTVYYIPFSQFDFVPGGEDLMDVANLTHLQVRAYFDEPEVGKLAKGQPVKIVWDAKRGEVWHGHVALAPTTINTYGTRNVGVCIITVDDPTPDLIPNTNVTVTVTELQRNHILTIPREALHTEGTRNYVFGIVNGKLSETDVKVGAVNLTLVEILSGLAENDKVVIGAKSSITELTPGLTVKQVE